MLEVPTARDAVLVRESERVFGAGEPRRDGDGGAGQVGVVRIADRQATCRPLWQHRSRCRPASVPVVVTTGASLTAVTLMLRVTVLLLALAVVDPKQTLCAWAMLGLSRGVDVGDRTQRRLVIGDRGAAGQRQHTGARVPAAGDAVLVREGQGIFACREGRGDRRRGAGQVGVVHVTLPSSRCRPPSQRRSRCRPALCRWSRPRAHRSRQRR